MKAIINWIFLIPVLVFSVGIELYTTLNPSGAQSFFGMDINGISEIIIISIVALFALTFVLSLFDRKTSPVHILKHNYPAGISAVVAAFALAGDTASVVAEAVRGSGLGTMDVFVVVASALASVALLLVGINHCTASNTKNTVALLYLAIPLWCAVHLLSRFMSHTAQPVAMADTMDLVMYVFLAIFFMYAMMVVSLINGKNPVKATIYWGAPAAVAAFVYSASLLGNVLNNQTASLFDYLNVITYGFIGLYVLSFVAELSFMSGTKDEIRVIDDTAEETEEELEAETEATADTSDSVSDEEAVASESEAFAEDGIEAEISQSTKKYFDDISSVESEITEENGTETAVVSDIDSANTTSRDYGSYFDTEENDVMYIESENVAVDTAKKRFVDKSKYPVTGQEATHQHAVRDEYVVGLDQVGEKRSVAVKEDISDYVLTKTAEETSEQKSKAKDSYESRLDEIDRLIISIQGGDSENK